MEFLPQKEYSFKIFQIKTNNEALASIYYDKFFSAELVFYINDNSTSKILINLYQKNKLYHFYAHLLENIFYINNKKTIRKLLFCIINNKLKTLDKTNKQTKRLIKKIILSNKVTNNVKNILIQLHGV